jgi:predicted dehydrogenase
VIRVGVIGFGYWGPNLARNFHECPATTLVAVADPQPARLADAARRFPGSATLESAEALLARPGVDAVAIATPVVTHAPLALAALRAGKHVLVEKPLAASVAEGEAMVAEADRRGLVLMVDHTFVYTPAVRRIRQLVDGGDLGDIYYYDSVRINLGLFQHDVNVLWDLAVHDLSIMDYVLGRHPVSVSATGMSHVPGKPEDVAYLTMFYEGTLLGHVHASWLAPVKVRRTLIGGSRRMIVFDDLEASEKVKVYDRGISVDPSPEDRYQVLVGYRSGDMWAPHLPVAEALQQEVAHFAECIASGAVPLTDGYAGLRMVRLLEAGRRSLEERGATVPLAAPAAAGREGRRA